EPRLRQRRAEHREGRRRAGQPDRDVAEEAAELRRAVARPGGRRQAVHGPGRRHARQRGPGPGRGDRRAGVPGGRPAREPAGGLGPVRALRTALVGVAAAAVLLVAAVPAAAASEPPWRAAEALRTELFEAQSALIVRGPDEASDAIAAAREQYDGALASSL